MNRTKCPKTSHSKHASFYETVKMCYEKINRNNKDLERLEAWIEDTRIKLKKNLLVKQDKEDMNEQMYSYMHAILGP